MDLAVVESEEANLVVAGKWEHIIFTLMISKFPNIDNKLWKKAAFMINGKFYPIIKVNVWLSFVSISRNDLGAPRCLLCVDWW